jgi:prolyl 4-hydroxylase
LRSSLQQGRLLVRRGWRSKPIRDREISVVNGIADSHTELSIPFSRKYAVANAVLFVVDNFLSADECEQLSEAARAGGDGAQGVGTDKAEQLHRSVDVRVSKLIGLPFTATSTLLGVDKLLTEQCYRDPPSDDGVELRTLIYLNDINYCHSRFPCLDETVGCVAGRLLIFNAGQTSELSNNRTSLSGDGLCMISTYCCDRNRLTISKQRGEYLKPLTWSGYAVQRLNEDVHLALMNFYVSNKNMTEPEPGGGFIKNSGGNEPSSLMLPLPKALQLKLQSHLRPAVESWCARRVEPTFVYGIRIYQSGATLVLHRDRPTTHIIGAIVNIDQETDVPWPLMIEDHFHRMHEVVLCPGEVLIFESARLLHGRPKPLCGRLYANVFCHFVPCADCGAVPV